MRAAATAARRHRRPRRKALPRGSGYGRAGSPPSTSSYQWDTTGAGLLQRWQILPPSLVKPLPVGDEAGMRLQLLLDRRVEREARDALDECEHGAVDRARRGAEHERPITDELGERVDICAAHRHDLVVRMAPRALRVELLALHATHDRQRDGGHELLHL